MMDKEGDKRVKPLKDLSAAVRERPKKFVRRKEEEVKARVEQAAADENRERLRSVDHREGHDE